MRVKGVATSMFIARGWGQVEKLKLLDARMKLVFETGLDCQLLVFE